MEEARDGGAGAVRVGEGWSGGVCARTEQRESCNPRGAAVFMYTEKPLGNGTISNKQEGREWNT